MRRLTFCILLLAVACTAPERPVAEDHLVEPPDAFHGKGKDEPDVDTDWWRKLGNDELTKAIERTLAHNNDLRAAQARLAAAAIRAELAGAELWPTLNLGAGASRQRQVFVGFGGFGGSSPFTNTYNSFGINLNASWEVDLWGRLAAAGDAALADLQATAQDLRGLRQSLAAQTAKAWFAAVEARQQIALATRTVKTYEATEAQVEDRFRRGVRTALDLRLARSRTQSARALQHRWDELLAAAVRQLELIQGKYPKGTFAVPLELPETRDPIPSGLPADLIRRRPDLAAAERRLTAAGFRVDEAQASLYPRLALSGQVGTTSDQSTDLLDLDYLAWNVAANLVQPVFDAGRLRGRRDLAIVAEHEAVELFAGAALRAYTEVETLLASETPVREQIAALELALVESRTAQQISEDRYRRGLGDFITVLESQRSALSIEAQLLTARRALLDLRVDLHLALGGGFELDPSSAPDAE